MIKIDNNGNKKIHVGGLVRGDFSVQTNREGTFNLHRLPIGSKLKDLNEIQLKELYYLIQERAVKKERARL